MGFTRFVEIGRVCLINYGPDRGKLCTIVDIIDSKKVLVDGPQEITGIHRQVMTLKRLSLTDVVAKGLKRGACQKNVKAAWASQNVKAAWESCAWAQKLSNKAKRDSLGDFDRFKLMVARKQRATLINAKL